MRAFKTAVVSASSGSRSGSALYENIVLSTNVMYDRIYYGLLHSSRYMWFYTEGSTQYLNHMNIRPGMIEAIQRAQAKAIEDANQ